MIPRIVLLALSLSACSVWAADAPPLGGQGSYTMNQQCLDTGSRLVPQVCADITFHYELSAFMGEPLAHYGLIWRLRYFTVKGGRSFSGDEARGLFGAAADRIALMVQGTAEVRQKSGVRLTLPNIDVIGENPSFLVVDIDSGVATRAGKMSWNIAGSPDWSKFLMHPAGGECAGGMGDAHAATNTGIRKYASSATAKAVMKMGNLELGGRQICRKGTLVEGLEDLESAIVKVCQPKSVTKGVPDKPYSWCPDMPMPGAALTPKSDEQAVQSQPTASLVKALDDIATQSQIEKKLTTLRSDYREAQRPQCQQKMDEINRCMSKAKCENQNALVASTAERCNSIPSRPEVPSVSRVYADAYQREWNKYNRDWEDWSSQYLEIERGCREARKCADESASKCNPGGVTLNRCLDQAMKHAPTLEDARKQVMEAKPAPRKPNQPTSFLD